MPSGTYKLEVWGAQGGVYSSSYPNNGGKGGYSCGTLTLKSSTVLYLYAGGMGSGANTSGGFNGGGATKNYGGSGGGASDIRIGSTSLYARVIVAGGGGGAGYSDTRGGYGGGTSGGQGGNGTTIGGYGGTQTSGGTNNTPGSFGTAESNTGNGGGGGGGWYGGSSGTGGDTDSGGGGGSGYVYTSSTASSYPSGCLLNSSYYLTNAATIAGNQSFPSPSGTNETGHSGDGYVRITVLSLGGGLQIQPGDVLNFPYVESYYAMTLPPGTYKLEVWGAQGGAYSSSYPDNGGKGGYSYGTLTLNQQTTLYIYVGGMGKGPNNPGGFNGGGSTNSYGGSGGGGTDIRINSTSLYARVIVAGGGGGAGYSDTRGGYGGGLTGGQGGNGTTTGGYGGTQTSGGTNNTPGTFGQANSNTGNGGGGGGGWYGGSSGAGSSTDSGGGGGSGYVYTSSTASNYPAGCLLNSSYYLTNAATLVGNTSFPSPSGANEVGHSGDGYARITVLNLGLPIFFNIGGSLKKYSDGWVKIDGSLRKIEAIWIKVDGVLKKL